MNSRLLAPLGLLALVALGVVWFLQNFERVPGKEKVPPSPEVRLREFLAAERFAERMGMPARELRSLGDLDTPPAGVLLMPRRRQAIDARRAVRLMGWVQRGGHLIVEAELIGVADPLLEAAGVRREARKEPSQPLVVDLGERYVTVQLASRMSLRAAGRPRLQLADQLVSVPRGKGLVTAVTTLDFARNPAIGAPGHAELLWELLTLSPAPGLQVFFHPERLSLWDFLAENAAPALAGAFLLLGLWLWRIAPRFGPVPADAPPARRRLLEHLRASGRYLWMEGLRGELAAAARDAALRRLARAQPDFAAASASERAARLASLAAIPLEDAQRFLAAGGSPRGAELMRIAAIAQRVHFALEKGTR
ncbi:MAG TPA: DUF4350 domain-containing protein [Burkholderiales bacterium]